MGEWIREPIACWGGPNGENGGARWHRADLAGLGATFYALPSRHAPRSRVPPAARLTPSVEQGPQVLDKPRNQGIHSQYITP